jgi:hypothetical protein
MTELTALSVDTPLEALLDRTACLVPNVQIFEADGNWTKPAHALWIEFVMINAGQDGATADTPAGGGGGGGASGCFRHVIMPAAEVPSALIVSVPQTVADGNASAIHATSDWQIVNYAGSPTPPVAGGAGGGAGGLAPALYFSQPGASGGAGGNAGLGGAFGFPGITGGGGDSSAPAVAGYAGLGYGAGGGGNSRSGSAGGGGGGGGYGVQALASGGNENSEPPGVGAPGVVIITTWRGIAV